jgi:hypothetical protein
MLTINPQLALPLQAHSALESGPPSGSSCVRQDWMRLRLVRRDRLKNNGTECDGGSNMSLDTTDSNAAEKLRKPYHAPELTTLGPIESVVRAGNPGAGTDTTDCGNPMTMGGS